VPAGQERCPACGATVAPFTEGALAPDPAVRARPEPLREIPGLKKKERTWKDEVRERMRDRKRRRDGDGELPLFRDEGEGDEDPGALSDDEPESAVSAEPDAPGSGPRTLGGLGEVGLATPVELGVDEADLPLRPQAAVTLRGADLRLAAPDPAAREPGREPASLPERPRREPVERPRVESPRGRPDADTTRGETSVPLVEGNDWTLGPAPGAEQRPVERPAHSGERAQAAALDLVLLAVLWAVVVYFASRAAHVGLMGLRPAWPYLAGYLAFLGLAYACYFTGTTGQTLGKIATGLRVVDAAGRPPGYLRAFARAAVGTVGVAAAGTGLIPMLLDPARRALHDRLLKTRVVKN